MEGKGEDGEEERNKAKEPEKWIFSRGKEVGCEEEKEDYVEAMDEDGVEEIELGELDLDEIEKECKKQGKSLVLRRKIELLKEAIMKTKALSQ